ncbi:MAG: hypothetical protein AAGE93_25220 [Bacteroidota bacterium]
MDLDFWVQEALGQLFCQTYQSYLPAVGLGSAETNDLFVYFKLYRANVRAKVLTLQAVETKRSSKLTKEVKRYLTLMNHYFSLLE